MPKHTDHVWAFAVDAGEKDNSTKDKVDVSKNPLTGTVTKKKKKMVKHKDASGEHTMEKTDVTKTHTDGKVETKSEVKTDSEKH